MNLKPTLLALTLLACQGVEDRPAARSAPEPGSPEWKIQNAMSAAPDTLAMNATIVDWATDAAAEPVILRQGSNGWRCTPSVLDVPFDNPMCLDNQALVWMRASRTGVTPELTAFGFGYMLAGGATASDTDPHAAEPRGGTSWRATSPHLIVIAPPEMLPLFEFPADASAGGPWLRWAGTPYAHIVIPVSDVVEPTADSGTTAWKIENAESAAPAAVARGATIVDFAAAGAVGNTTMRRGDNGWTCLPDAPGTPYNDPNCIDRMGRVWFHSMGTTTAPDLTAAGLSYMLQGSIRFAFEERFRSPEEREFEFEPPHVMIFLPLKVLDAVTLLPDPASGGPWLMFPGTDFAHIMIPVR